MRILVIGGSGAIGRHLVSECVSRGDNVVVLTRGKSECEPHGGLVSTVHADRTDLNALASSTTGYFDCVVDLACFREDDARGAIATFAGRVGQYVYCSSSAVTGPFAGVGPINEQVTCHPISIYGHHKLAAELAFRHAHYSKPGFPLTIVRPVTVIGGGGILLRQMGADRTFVGRLRAKMPILVLNTAKNVNWDVVSSGDCARSIRGCIGSGSTIGRTLNIAGPYGLTWRDYHAAVARAIGAPKPIMIEISLEKLLSLRPRLRTLRTVTAWGGRYDGSSLRHLVPNCRHTDTFDVACRASVRWMEDRNLLLPPQSSGWEDRIISSYTRQLDV